MSDDSDYCPECDRPPDGCYCKTECEHVFEVLEDGTRLCFECGERAPLN